MTQQHSAWRRALPTPCRAPPPPITVEERWHLEVLDTLLDESAAQDDEWAFLAATLLDTLVEYCPHARQQTIAPACPCEVSLERTVPLSPHQHQTLKLLEALPHQLPSEEHDWLDNDLDVVLKSKALPLEVRTSLVNVQPWHHVGAPPPDCLEIYTDGSAAMSPNDLGPCAWAFSVFAIVGSARLLIGHASAPAFPANSTFHIGESTDDALTAELLAICWALCWTAQHGRRFGVPVEFLYDALAAGGGAFGVTVPVGSTGSSPYLALAGFAVALRQYTAELLPIKHSHVKGHTGCLGNELCDALAKHARRLPQDDHAFCLPDWPRLWAMHPLRDWAWATLPGHGDLASLFCFGVEASLGRRVHKAPPCSPTFGVQDHHLPSTQVGYVFFCVTLNVLTLREPRPHQSGGCTGLRITGRKDVLKASLKPFDPLFVGLQETRLPDSSVLPDADYYIYSSGATASGTGGCALWVAKDLPLYTEGNQAVRVKPQDVTVVGASHRHLAVNLVTPRIQLHIQVVHAPSAASVPIDVCHAFWNERACEILRRPEGADFLILCDANSRLGDCTSELVGDCGAEQEGPAGEAFHAFLVKVGALAPSTWSQWHQGGSPTWCSPNGTWSRIDYVLVPSTWRHAVLVSRTLPQVELLQVREDHFPAHLLCAFTRPAPPSFYQSSQKRVIRPAKQEVAQADLDSFAHSLPQQPWSSNVDEHYAELVQAWHGFGDAIVRHGPTVPRQPYLTTNTLDLIQERKALRPALKNEAQERRLRWLILGFGAFILHSRGDSFNDAQLALADSWMRTVDRNEAVVVANYRRTAFALRRAVAADKAAHIQVLADDLAARNIQDSRSLYQALRKVFPSARASRRSSARALPMLQLDDGSFATTTSDRAEAWRRHFASQEAGTLVTPDEYAADLQASEVLPWQLDMRVPPTLAKVEQLIISAKRGKAAGPDGITTELLQLNAPAAARQLIPVYLKATLRVYEPVAFRGGDLCCLAKRASGALTCEAFRSILVSSVPGKLLHRNLREVLKPLLVDSQPVFQSGVAAGQGIVGVALVARTFFSMCSGQGSYAALAFFDLQAAFYGILRQTIVPHAEDDSKLLRLFYDLRLPAEAISELKAHLESIAQLPLLGASSHAIAIVQDLFRGTISPGRPDDLLFGFSLAAALKAIQHRLVEADLVPHLPCTQRPTCVDLEGPIPIGQPAWADDFVAPQNGPTPVELVQRTGATIRTIVDYTTSVGMTVKCGRDKTAVLFPPAVLQRAEHLFERDDQGQLCLGLENGVTHTHYQVPIVESYRHLGGIVTSTGTPLEQSSLCARSSSALASEYPLDTRAYILRSLVLSKFAHSAASLMLCVACHARVWEQHYMSLWRTLFRRKTASCQKHCYRVLHEAQAASPTLALASARAGFVSRLFRHGPKELLALLWDHWVVQPRTAWLAQLRDDIALVSSYVPDVVGLLGNDRVLGLLDAYSHDCSWWPRQVKTATKIFLRDLATWVTAGQEPARRLVSGTPAGGEYACYLCQASFPLRKHLHVHLARAHQVFSPARHYATSETCAACHKVFPNILLAQQHLKRSDACLMRCLYLHRPLTCDQFRQLEVDMKVQQRKVRRGGWRHFRGIVPSARAPFAFGPKLPTTVEKLQGSSTAGDESDLLSTLTRGFHPEPAHVVWVTDFVQGRSREKARTTAHRFWMQRPCVQQVSAVSLTMNS
ncbi:tyrP-A [Symbiodinium sp. CCMP2592]|nr:tyrP-A [Symbiodinium sp. CCMP2592]